MLRCDIFLSPERGEIFRHVLVASMPIKFSSRAQCSRGKESTAFSVVGFRMESRIKSIHVQRVLPPARATQPENFLSTRQMLPLFNAPSPDFPSPIFQNATAPTSDEFHVNFISIFGGALSFVSV